MTIYAEPKFPPLPANAPEFDRLLLMALALGGQNLKAILDGGISFTDNMDVSIVTYTSNASPDTEDTVAHGLGKVPTGYIPVSKDKAGDVYTSSAADATNLKLKCTVASVALKLLIF